jgi:hypothetical protein
MKTKIDELIDQLKSDVSKTKFSKGVLATVLFVTFIVLHFNAQPANENLAKPDPKYAWSNRTITEVYFDAEDMVKASKNADPGPESDELRKIKLPAKQYGNAKMFKQLFSNTINSGKYKAYNAKDYKLLSSKEVKDIIMRVDTQIVQNIKTGGWDTTYIKTNIGEKIVKYKVITDWFYDAAQNKMETKIVGLAPMIVVINKGTGDFIGWKPLFWIYFE